MIHDWRKYRNDYKKSWDNYLDIWVVSDKVLYEMCRDFPLHKKKAEIAAKVGLIERGYSAGLERHAKDDMLGIITFFHKNGKFIDDLFRKVNKIKEPLTESKLQTIVSVHGEFTTLLKKITNGRSSVRSFVSKYMHFHCLTVPIYDNIAAAVIRQRDWYPLTKSNLMRFSMPKGADELYFNYCISFFSMYTDLKEVGMEVNVRRLDRYLLWNNE